MSQKFPLKHLGMLRQHSLPMFEHSIRTGVSASIIANSLELPKTEMEKCFVGGLMHDIGKCFVPEWYLDSAKKLDYLGYETVKDHVKFGLKMLNRDPPRHIIEAVSFHHERWDGSGYPYGIKGEEIPIHVRIISVADAFDAMTSSRQYQANRTSEMALIEIMNNEGVQFCPLAVKGLMNAIAHIEKSKRTYIDYAAQTPGYEGIRDLYEEERAC